VARELLPAASRLVSTLLGQHSAQTDMPRDKSWRALGKYYGLAFLIPTSILIGYGIGYFLDKAFHTTFLSIVFLLLGIAAGLIETIRELSKPDDR
jgi:F0F1-type ATP synthase assembly protein I